MTIVESYFDESYTNDGTNILCVAGYLIDCDEARELEHEWKQVLRDYKLPFFHMTECNSTDGVFDHLTLHEADKAARRMIRIIKRRVRFGVAITIDLNCWNRITSGSFGSAYSWAVSTCFSAVQERISDWSKKGTWDGRISYIFESGHKDQKETECLIQERYASNPYTIEQYRYLSHSFVKKVDSCGAQAADILAWQWTQDLVRKGKGQRRRGDLRSILEVHHKTMHWGEGQIKRLKIFMDEKGATLPAPSPQEAEKIVSEWYNLNP